MFEMTGPASDVCVAELAAAAVLIDLPRAAAVTAATAAAALFLPVQTH